jgi:hypothetical protein
MATARLLGRTTALAGVAEEISVGAGLTFSALNLAWNGTSPVITTDIRPVSHDGASLGTAALAFSDLFLGAGAVTTWGAASTPDATLTHSTGKMAWDGADYLWRDGSTKWQISAGYTDSALIQSYPSLLQINNLDGINNWCASFTSNTNSSDGVSIAFASSRNTELGNWAGALQDDDDIQTFTIWGSDGTNLGLCGRHGFRADATFTTNTVPTRWELWTNDGSGLISGMSVRMTVTPDGDVLIGPPATPIFHFDLDDGTGYPALNLLGGSGGPAFGSYITFYSNAGTGAANDFLGGVYTYARTTTGAEINAGGVELYTDDATNGSFYSRALFTWKSANSNRTVLGQGNALSPNTNNTVALGTSTKAWSDAFFASGAVLDFDSDITLTHASNLLTGAGGSFAFGGGALATSATNGFLYVPTCAGTPTGVPETVTGYAPIIVNTTNNKLYFYSGGAWRDAGP